MNQILKLLIVALMVGVTFASAAQISIDKQIQIIQHAPLKQRVKLINQLKTRLRNMNQQERMQAINTLQKQMHINNLNSNNTKAKSSTNQNLNNVNQIQQNSYQQTNYFINRQTNRSVHIPMH